MQALSISQKLGLNDLTLVMQLMLGKHTGVRSSLKQR